MSDLTFADIVERTFREYLHKADEVPITGKLTTPTTSSSPTFTLDTTTLPPEHSYLIGPNVIVEMDYELILVRDYDPATGIVTGDRGFYATEAEAHSTYVRLAPEPTRIRVYEALRDTVRGLWPRLGYLNSCVTTVSGGVAELPADTEMLLHVEEESSATTVPDVRLSRSPNKSSTSRSLITDLGSPTSLYVEYLARPLAPDHRDEYLTDWNVDEAWQRILMIGVLADLAATRDLSAANLEALTELVQQQGFPVGSGTSIHRALLRYQDILVRDAAAAVASSHKNFVTQYSPF